MPKQEKKKLPSTLERSPRAAQHMYGKVHDRAVDEYGEGQRAHRTAFAALKHSFEKVGDHWAPKKRKGPSDPRSTQKSTQAKREGKGETFGGVDLYGNTKQELMARARQLKVSGRSKMNKKELARAIAKKQ